jgi:hypothetical protein
VQTVLRPTVIASLAPRPPGWSSRKGEIRDASPVKRAPDDLSGFRWHRHRFERPRRLAAATKNGHNGCMSKTRVEFKYKRIAEGEWQIEAHYPGAEVRHIKGFKSKAEIDEWLQGSRRIDWLRSQGYAK